MVRKAGSAIPHLFGGVMRDGSVLVTATTTGEVTLDTGLLLDTPVQDPRIGVAERALARRLAQIAAGAPLVPNNRKSESKPVPSHSRLLPPKDRKAPTPCRWFNPSAMYAFSPGRWNSTKDPNAAKLSSAVASTLKSRPTAGQSAAASTSPPAGRCSLENQSWRKPSERDGPTQAC